MPTYDYHCSDCNQDFELFHAMSATQDNCTQCQGTHIRKRISGGSGVIFKGSGFYETDYKRQKETNKEAKSNAPGDK